MLFDRTLDLQILQHTPKLRYREDASLWIDYPSWAVDLHYILPIPGELEVVYSGHFSSNGTSMIVDGVRIGVLTAHWAFDSLEHGQQALIRNLRNLHDLFLAEVASLLSRSLEETWLRWWHYVLQVISGEYASTCERLASNVRSFGDFLAKLKDDELRLRDVWVLLAADCCYCDGRHRGRLASYSYRITREESLMSGIEIWVLKGAASPFVLHNDANGNYSYKGNIPFGEDEERVRLDAAFFATRDIERITIV